MNHLVIQQKSFAAGEEMRATATATGHRYVETKEVVVCPKPRRLGLLHATLSEPSLVRPLRWHSSLHQEVFDAKPGNQLLDIILAKGTTNCVVDESAVPIASPPPFFCGSPPSRVSNPLIQDSQFGNVTFTPVSPHGIATPSSTLAHSPSSARKPGGCIRVNFGNNPAVRIEGFDCLDRDRRGCSIPAIA